MIKGVTYDDENDLIAGVTYDLVRGVVYDEPETSVAADTILYQPPVKTQPSQSINALETISEIIPAELLNFSLKLDKRLIKFFDTEAGERSDFSYLITVTVRKQSGGIQVFQANVAGDKVKNTAWLMKATNSLASDPKSKDEREEFIMKVQKTIETENVPVEISYPNAGWRDVPGIGWRYVYGEGCVGDESGLIHSSIPKYSLATVSKFKGTANLFNKAIAMCDICKSGRASTELFLYLHASLMAELFHQAGHDICFVFGVLGVTNSRKTSLVTAVAKLFNRECLVADAEFATATACGIEKTLSLYKDGVVLIDDFKPGANKAQQAVMNEKLDQLLRFYGNRVAKKRMTEFATDGDKKYFPINGGCVITMEIVDGVLSSMTRMFLTEITADEVNNDRLAYFQEKRWILPTHVYDFLDWLTVNFQATIAYFVTKFPEMRGKYHFEFPRYAEMYAILMLTAHVIGVYAVDRSFWTQEANLNWQAKVEECLVSELQLMGQRWKDSDKGALALAALCEALRSGKCIPVMLTEASCKLRADLYEDETFYFMRTKYLKVLANEFSKKYGETCQILNDSELVGLMERKQMIEIKNTSDGRKEASRKLPIQKGNTLRYLYIHKAKLLAYENE